MSCSRTLRTTLYVVRKTARCPGWWCDKQCTTPGRRAAQRRVCGPHEAPMCCEMLILQYGNGVIIRSRARDYSTLTGE